MAKTRTIYVCQQCGAQSPKWMGRCTTCGEWNTYIEEQEAPVEKVNREWEDKKTSKRKSSKAVLLEDVESSQLFRVSSKDGELDRVLGGGIVPGSVILIGGEPGIGKSTLLLQVSLSMGKIRILYISGEESEQQIKMRAERLQKVNKELYVLTETSIDSLFKQVKELQPELLIIDSIQTLHSPQIDSAAGSVSQIRHCAAALQQYAKETNTPVMIIGHINKEGYIAGPKVLEHMVDTVLQFEGDPNHSYRILRTTKNRFGSTAELGIYEMSGYGLREVSNPSEILITQREENLSGVSIASTIEGARPMLIETQALVSPAVYGNPQRSTTGFDLRRLNMILAVLEKRAGFHLGNKDVFLNIAGGLKVTDPAIDLAIISAIMSSYQDQALPDSYCFTGEVGLSGEIRPVSRMAQRIAEADKLGYSSIFLSKYGMKGIDPHSYKIKLIPVSRIDELYNQLF